MTAPAFAFMEQELLALFHKRKFFFQNLKMFTFCLVTYHRKAAFYLPEQKAKTDTETQSLL